MSNSKKLILTICSMCLVLAVGVVGIFAATNVSVGLSSTITWNPTAGSSATDIVGNCVMNVSGGATTNNGTTAASASSKTVSFSATNSSAASGTCAGGTRYFSAHVSGGNKITLTATTTITDTTQVSSPKIKYTCALNPTTLTNATIVASHTYNGTSFSTSTASVSKVVAKASGTNAVFVSTYTITIKDFGFAVASTAFTMTLGATTTTDAVS